MRCKHGGKKLYSYCTLFDKNYIDKGIVMIRSLLENTKSSRIYVLAMDNECYKILEDIGLERLILIKLDAFEDERLLHAKVERSRSEYCWTCTASLIYYIFENYDEKYCTYIDADMYFYSNPDLLIDNMVEMGKSVQVIEHRFKNNYMGKYLEKASGRFCVEFNTFANNDDGRNVLTNWKEQTLERCSSEKMGDQMYLNSWLEQYNCIHVIQNIGAGVAPWNVNRYKLISEQGNKVIVSYDNLDNFDELIFFHFHDIRYLDKNLVDIGVHKRFWKVDMRLVKKLYIKYLNELDSTKNWLEKEYYFYPLLRIHPTWENKSKSILERIHHFLSDNLHENACIKIMTIFKNILFRKYDIISLNK